MKEYLRLILILLIPLVLVSVYSFCGVRLAFNDWGLRKIQYWDRILAEMNFESEGSGGNVDSINIAHIEIVDSILLKDSATLDKPFSPDTCKKRILFFGDSMVEGLSLRFSDYAQENGHLLYTVCWYGSSTTGWASDLDTLNSFLRWSKADYVVVSLGGNELRIKDLDFRAQNIRKIQEALGDRPTVWIAPPSWVKKPTITEVIRSVVGESRYFDSTRLTYQRGSDNMHPTFASSSRWMDSIAVWMSSQHTAHPIVMKTPSKEYPRKWKRRFIFPD